MTSRGLKQHCGGGTGALRWFAGSQINYVNGAAGSVDNDR